MHQLSLLAKTLAFQQAPRPAGDMKRGFSITTHHRIVKGFALEHTKATKREKGILLDVLCAETGLSREDTGRFLQR
ncbi:hypothetical protein [Glutamicibacter sp. NPDC087344]|uniref:hypothetical protein n=1 Tax=Glutamicibacter sp. NPDC087344 TaxID=3363994 RepID=UPI0037F84E46